MSLTPGSRLGPYDVTALLGEGGMGQVFRARDTRLDRDVAIKILPEAFAHDADRLARFTREAKTLAALNHPHIAAIYGLEESSGITALVMELVEGDDLSQRISRLRAAGASAKQAGMPLDEALPIAQQIAEALEAAHEQGIIHRDLKPANIKVRRDGTVKVLDFGLAKAVDANASNATADAMNSPTITSPAMTQAGMILGTAAYMAPEQARGKTVDKRADIWAFGAVLYEMLTGTRAFAGDGVSETLARVLEREPDWSRLPSQLSPALRTYLQRCLQKDPRQRVRDIGDMRLALAGAFGAPDGASVIDTTDRNRGHTPAWKRATLLAAGAVAIAAAAALAGRASVPVSPRPVIRAVHRLPPGRAISSFVMPPLAIDPAGRAFAYATTGGQLYVKTLDATEDRQVTAGDAFADMPFFSTDGLSLGYRDASDKQLKRIDRADGRSTKLAQIDLPASGGGPSASMRVPRGAWWGSDGSVTYALPDSLWRVPANGGGPERLFAAADGEQAYGPQVLPGGKGILFTLARSLIGRSWDDADIVILAPATDAPRVVVSGGRAARYLPTGHLLYIRGDVLYGVPFDLDRLTTAGTPVPVLDGVRSDDPALSATAVYAVSDEGTLVYQRGRVGQSAVVWTTADGRQEPIDVPPGSYGHPRLSPDGRWLALERRENGRTDVWVVSVVGGTAMRRITEEGDNRYPIWTRDSSFVVFQSSREGDRGIFRQPIDRTAPAERLSTAAEGTQHVPESWSLTEDRLAYSVQRPSAAELWMWTQANRAGRRVGTLQSLQLFNAAFSPDGRWLAYTQRGDVDATWVASVGAPEIRYQVGLDAEVAHHPLWSPDGRRLYLYAALTPMAVDVTTEPTFTVGRPTPITGLIFNLTPETELNHDIARDGSRFVTIVPGGRATGAGAAEEIITVYNWFEELQRLVPVR